MASRHRITVGEELRYNSDLAGIHDLSTTYVPQWKPNTAYTSGQYVLNPSGQIVSANTSFTSGGSYNAANWTATSGGGGGGTAVTTYASGLAVTVGQLVAHQGITYRVTTSHTTGALPDLTKLAAFNAEPSIFYPESYGAIGDGTAHPLSEVYGSLAAAQAVYPFAQALTDTVDQCAIQAAINAAVAAGDGVVQLADKVYVVDGSFRTADNGRALLSLPYFDPSGSRAANIEIRGAVGAGVVRTNGDAAGGTNASVIMTTLTGAAIVSGRVPCVIGGPSVEISAPYTLINATIRDLTVLLPNNPTMAGVDLGKTVDAYLDGVTVATNNSTSIQPTTTHAFGVRMPSVTNYGVSRVGSLAVFGFYAAVVANTEHFNADDLVLKYNYGGLCLTGLNGWHGVNIKKLMSEWQCYHIASWTAVGGIQQLPTYPAIVNIGLLDIEDAPGGWYSTAYHIVDDNNLLRGRVQYVRAVAAGAAGPTNGLLLRGATKVQLTDLFMPVSNYGGGVLAVTQYTVAANVTTASTTFADIDATNLKVTFTAPSSGNVLVRLEGFVTGASASGYAWNLRDSGGNIAGTQRDVVYGASSPLIREAATLYVTGLTPGTSYTWKWGHGLSSGSGTCTFDQATVVMVVTAA